MVNFQTVKFHNDDIEIVDTFVSVKRLCQNIGITGISDQYKKIKSDDSFESKSIDVEINGIIQEEVVVIPHTKINGWLFSISVNKVKPEVREKLIEYKKECFDVLNNYFNKGYAINKNMVDPVHHQKVISGYKSQLSQKNTQIKECETQIIILQGRVDEMKPYFDKCSELEIKHDELKEEFVKLRKEKDKFAADKDHVFDTSIVVHEISQRLRHLKNELEGAISTISAHHTKIVRV